MNQPQVPSANQNKSLDEITDFGAGLAQIYQSHPGGRETPLTPAKRQEFIKLLQAHHLKFLLTSPSVPENNHSGIKH